MNGFIGLRPGLAAYSTGLLAAVLSLFFAATASAAPGAPTIAPHTSQVFTPDGSTDFEFTGDAEATSFRCAVARDRLGDPEPQLADAMPCTSPWNTGPLEARDRYVVAVWALDSAEEPSEPATKSFSSMVAPVVAIEGQPEDGAITSDPFLDLSFTMTNADLVKDFAGYECLLNGTSASPRPDGACPQLLAEVPDGTHTLSVRGLILESPSTGTWAGPAATRTFTVDTRAPDTQLTASEGPLVIDEGAETTTATFEFSGADPAPGTSLTYECRFRGSPWEPCESPFTDAALPAGEYRFAVRAIDAAGNVDPTPAARQFKVVQGPLPPSEEPEPTEPSAACQAITFMLDSGRSGLERLEASIAAKRASVRRLAARVKAADKRAQRRRARARLRGARSELADLREQRAASQTSVDAFESAYQRNGCA